MSIPLAIALLEFAGLLLIVLAASRAFRDWTGLRREELRQLQGQDVAGGQAEAATALRIALADLSARVRRLEQLAASTGG